MTKSCAFTHPGTAVFAWNDYGRFLLIRRSPGRAGEGLWSLPGGRLERHETWRAAGIREVREETGIHISPPSLVALSTTTEDQGWLTIWMTAKAENILVEGNEEISGYSWVRLIDLQEGFFQLWDAHWAPLLEETGGWDGLNARLFFPHLSFLFKRL